MADTQFNIARMLVRPGGADRGYCCLVFEIVSSECCWTPMVAGPMANIQIFVSGVFPGHLLYRFSVSKSGHLGLVNICLCKEVFQNMFPP